MTRRQIIALQGAAAEAGGDALSVCGWLMRFGVQGLDRRTFDAATQTWLPGHDDARPLSIAETPILWDHGQGPPGADAQGLLQSAERRGEGIWVEGALNARSKYLDGLQELLAKRALGWSAGSIAHLVEIVGSRFQRFPIVEATLTATPMQPLATATQWSDAAQSLLDGLQPAGPDARALAVQRQRIAVAEAIYPDATVDAGEVVAFIPPGYYQPRQELKPLIRVMARRGGTQVFQLVHGMDGRLIATFDALGLAQRALEEAVYGRALEGYEKRYDPEWLEWDERPGTARVRLSRS